MHRSKGDMTTNSKIEMFAQMARDDDGNAMIWYGLGNEYAKAERWTEAVASLRKVVEINPDYTAAYQMLGSALANVGELEAARLAWQEGVQVASRTGAWKAGQHMQGLLDALQANDAGKGDADEARTEATTFCT